MILTAKYPSEWWNPRTDICSYWYYVMQGDIMWYYWQCLIQRDPAFPLFPFKNNSKMVAGSRKLGEIHWSILFLFQGNILYLIWVIVEEYLGCQCRWGFGTVSQCLVGFLCMKFCLNLAHVHCALLIIRRC